VRAFDDAIGLTGLILTKLDGTAKGGVVAAIALARSKVPQAGADPAARRSKETSLPPIPIAYVGVGEGIDDLRPFVAAEFVSALFD